MKKYSYDRQRAKQLLPLLTSIGTEISERQEAIRRLQAEIAKLVDDEQAQPRVLNLRAELAEQRRALRDSREELEQLGCQESECERSSILIPGIDGSLERGFRWEFGDETVHRIQTSPNAA